MSSSTCNLLGPDDSRFLTDFRQSCVAEKENQMFFQSSGQLIPNNPSGGMVVPVQVSNDSLKNCSENCRNGNCVPGSDFFTGKSGGVEKFGWQKKKVEKFSVQTTIKNFVFPKQKNNVEKFSFNTNDIKSSLKKIFTP